jgi:multiple sugar transport system ATP-binding protein
MVSMASSLAVILARELAIDTIMSNRFRELSMGQKNRINLLRYLLQDFDMLICDEVLANVDEPTRNHILGTIKKLFPSRTFLYISHNATEVARFSKNILVLPVTTGRGHRDLRTLPGLDMEGDQKPRPEDIEKNVLLLLQAAATGTSIDNTAVDRKNTVEKTG